ncbi:MAG: tRNA 2-thiouridine(34) synthase MnmA [Leptospiraceae bacterium]|nr:tRNA 2-thiouridine(34) synthase MnmA [Leptospiraceae bacterium]
MKVAALISGGVDSSVALYLAREAGYDLTAFYLKVWLEDELEYLGQCPWEEDLEYVQAVCDQLDVPLQVVPIQQEYWQRVIEFALQEIEAGRTPNPDMLCNSRVKFGAFMDYIGNEYSRIITGHYARVRRTDDHVDLRTAPDPIKDQTYFLAHLNQTQLSRAEFPIGEYQKDQVRELAARFALPTATRPDSQGLCFLGKISFRDFVRHHLGERPGHFKEHETGVIVAQHRGYWFYTIGQRHGLGLAGGPWYVVSRDIAQNVVYISRSYYAEDKQRDSLQVSGLNWINRAPETDRLRVKLRHGPGFHDCTIEYIDADRLFVRLAQNDQGIAPGQYAVFYDKDICLGCGMIQ